MKILDRLVGEWQSAPTQRTTVASILGGHFIEMTDTDAATVTVDVANR